MPALDTNALVVSMQKAASGVLGKDVSTLRGFAQSQLQAIAQQSALVAAGVLDGSITPDLRDYFLDSLEEMARSFANTLAGLMTVVIEQVWNALVKTIWDAIGKATGLTLVAP